MKKTYKTPELFAVTLQHQDNVLVKTSFEVVGPGTGEADVKAFDFVDDEEDDAGTTTSPRNIWSEKW